MGVRFDSDFSPPIHVRINRITLNLKLKKEVIIPDSNSGCKKFVRYNEGPEALRSGVKPADTYTRIAHDIDLFYAIIENK